MSESKEITINNLKISNESEFSKKNKKYTNGITVYAKEYFQKKLVAFIIHTEYHVTVREAIVKMQGQDQEIPIKWHFTDDCYIFSMTYHDLTFHIFDNFKFSMDYLADSKFKANLEFSFQIEPFETRTPIKQGFLDLYEVEERWELMFKNQFQPDKMVSSRDKRKLEEFDEFYKKSLIERIESKDYFKMLGHALTIEDLEHQKEFEKFELENVKLQTEDELFWFSYDSSLFSELSDSLKEATLKLTPIRNFNDYPVIVGVADVTADKIFIKKKHSLHTSLEYNVSLLPNRIAFRAAHKSLESLEDYRLDRFFTSFQDPPKFCNKRPLKIPTHLSLFNLKILGNSEQFSAVWNILQRSTFPYPYCVFGPPGTGKTTVVVESVCQIIKHNPDARILITAQSNFACDEIAGRLLKYVERQKIYRYYSRSFENKQDQIPDELLEISNLKAPRRDFLSQEEFYHFQIFITTCVSSQRFVESQKKNPFDYVFIDEAASCMEPEALIPITGFAMNYLTINSFIVLFGDHKQLGPIVKSEFAAKLGLETSLMERILNTNVYRRNKDNYCIQLLDNYRSHPSILEFPNKLFYDGKLRSKLAKEEAETFVCWKSLPNPEVPIVLHSVFDPACQEGFSWYNRDEVQITRFWVDLLINYGGVGGKKVEGKDIGIVTPYKAQQLRMVVEFEGLGIEIGTPEHFQGREKNIMIVSTVKSGPGVTVGFLSNEKRLNVILTRAKHLLIVVCNPINLQRDAQWRDFIKFCMEKRVCFGEKIRLRENREVKKTSEKKSFFTLTREKKFTPENDLVEPATYSNIAKTPVKTQEKPKFVKKVEPADEVLKSLKSLRLTLPYYRQRYPEAKVKPPKCTNPLFREDEDQKLEVLGKISLNSPRQLNDENKENCGISQSVEKKDKYKRTVLQIPRQLKTTQKIIKTPDIETISISSSDSQDFQEKSKDFVEFPDKSKESEVFQEKSKESEVFQDKSKNTKEIQEKSKDFAEFQEKFDEKSMLERTKILRIDETTKSLKETIGDRLINLRVPRIAVPLLCILNKKKRVDLDASDLNSLGNVSLLDEDNEKLDVQILTPLAVGSIGEDLMIASLDGSKEDPKEVEGKFKQAEEEVEVKEEEPVEVEIQEIQESEDDDEIEDDFDILVKNTQKNCGIPGPSLKISDEIVKQAINNIYNKTKANLWKLLMEDEERSGQKLVDHLDSNVLEISGSKSLNHSKKFEISDSEFDQLQKSSEDLKNVSKECVEDMLSFDEDLISFVPCSQDNSLIDVSLIEDTSYCKEIKASKDFDDLAALMEVFKL